MKRVSIFRVVVVFWCWAALASALLRINQINNIMRKGGTISSKNIFIPTRVLFSQSIDDMDAKTRNCLDFPLLVGELERYAQTALGKLMCRVLPSSDLSVQTVRDNYAKLEQVQAHTDHLPFHGSLDMEEFLRQISNNTGLPDGKALARFAEQLEVLQNLQQYLQDNIGALPLLEDISRSLVSPPDLIAMFECSFDAEQQLSDVKYPSVRELRGKIVALKQSIETRLIKLSLGPAIGRKVVDSGCVEVDGRYCILVHTSSKHGLGIVHGTSNSGKTSLVEPYIVVEATNQLQELRSQLKREESRIYSSMCAAVYSHMESIRQNLHAAGELDVLAAKARLGRKLKGVIPEVGEEGVISCEDARNPVLLLRSVQKTILGNDISLSRNTPALIISGPNAGGKTIVLKTVGLLALMAQNSIPIPMRAGGRVDLFRAVFADIGDQQSASADVSTFSGHLLACKYMIEQVTEYSNSDNSLALLDEVGTGTDPEQGSALAQAILEKLVESGARVVATTHFQRVKELASTDSRFRIAGMEFIRDKPTFKLLLGHVGESFALETATRLNISNNILQRAYSLLTTESRGTAALQLSLQAQLEKTATREIEFLGKLREIEQQKVEMERNEHLASKIIREVREQRFHNYLLDIKTKEKELNELLADAQRIARQQFDLPSVEMNGKNVPNGNVEANLERMRDKLKSEKASVQKTLIAAQLSTSKPKAVPLKSGEVLEEGDELVVLEPGSTLQGACAVVSHRNRGHGRVVVRVAGAEVKMERHLLGIPVKLTQHAALNGENCTNEQFITRERRLQQKVKEEMVDPGLLSNSFRKSGSKGNFQETMVDLKSVSRYDEARLLVDTAIRSLSSAAGGGLRIVHGGSCAYKQKLRAWLKSLPLANSVEAASLSQGGNAVTILQLK